MDAGQPNQALEHMARAYGMDPADRTLPYALSESAAVAEGNVGETGGGYSQGSRVWNPPVTVEISRSYLNQEARDAGARERHFAHVAHTLFHEHTHARQRSDVEVMGRTNKPIREFQAYSAEALRADHLPPWPAEEHLFPVQQAIDHFNAARATPEYHALSNAERDAMRADHARLRALRQQLSPSAAGAAAAAPAPAPASASASSSSSSAPSAAVAGPATSAATGHPAAGGVGSAGGASNSGAAATPASAASAAAAAVTGSGAASPVLQTGAAAPAASATPAAGSSSSSSAGAQVKRREPDRREEQD